ncbi:MAG: aldehyde ferredoxin oxidoreductase C-terminal domain-containing protein, partial [Clostridia bacterium]
LRSSYYMEELNDRAPTDHLDKVRDFIRFESRNVLEDCLILCRFYQQFIGWDGMSTIIEKTTGMPMDRESMSNLAMGVTTAVRRFNIREGLRGEDDGLPERFFCEPVGEAGEYVVDRRRFEEMLAEYYRVHGWDETGMPVAE